MIKKTVEGVKNFLEKVFGPRRVVLDDKIAELPKERREKIAKIYEELSEKQGYEEQNNPLIKDGLMHMSKQGLAEIVLSEAITKTRYKDSANVWTIGIGATRSEIKNLSKWSNDREMSLEDIFTLFTKGIEKYSAGVRKALKVEVSQEMFDGLVSFAYNVGVGGMRGSSLIKAINRGVTDKKQLQAYLMRWNKIRRNGSLVVSRGLINRRKAEADVMFRSKYKNTKMIGRVVPVSTKTLRPIYRSKKSYTINLNKYL